MSAKDRAESLGWTIDGAEKLLRSLPGVVSVRIVAKPGGAVEEIHMLTTYEVTPKQTVRNVESALLAHFDLEVDHRKISVAQSRTQTAAEPEGPIPAGTTDPVVIPSPLASDTPRVGPILHTDPDASEARFVFCGNRTETERAHRVKMLVTVDWRGERYTGEASGPDLPRTRLETVAAATLRAIETALETEELQDPPHLALDGVKLVDAFDRRYVLVSVHAIAGRESASLAGSTAVEDSPDRAVIMSTLQATDRWVRGRI